MKNSWGPTWGDNGYMYIKMTDGLGIGGMLSTPPVYPVIGNGCTTPGVCGVGTCTSATSSDHGCSCPAGFVAINSQYGPSSSSALELCGVADVCATSTYNPCGVGTCTSNGKGGYMCTCPHGYSPSLTTTFAQTCVSSTALNSSVGDNSYVVKAGDSCASVAASFKLTLLQFEILNPTIICLLSLPVGSTVSVGPTAPSGCGIFYATNPGDTCASIADLFSLGVLDLVTLNPVTLALCLLNSIVSLPSLTVCVSPGTLSIAPQCGQFYTVSAGDSCQSVQTRLGIAPLTFFALNPGLLCTNVIMGSQVCVRPSRPSPPTRVACPVLHQVGRGQTCAYLASRYCSNSIAILEYLNGYDYSCDSTRIPVGAYVCVQHA